jgi:hypothetical protein
MQTIIAQNDELVWASQIVATTGSTIPTEMTTDADGNI